MDLNLRSGRTRGRGRSSPRTIPLTQQHYIVVARRWISDADLAIHNGSVCPAGFSDTPFENARGIYRIAWALCGAELASRLGAGARQLLRSCEGPAKATVSGDCLIRGSSHTQPSGQLIGVVGPLSMVTVPRFGPSWDNQTVWTGWSGDPTTPCLPGGPPWAEAVGTLPSATGAAASVHDLNVNGILIGSENPETSGGGSPGNHTMHGMRISSIPVQPQAAPGQVGVSLGSAPVSPERG